VKNSGYSAYAMSASAAPSFKAAHPRGESDPAVTPGCDGATDAEMSWEQRIQNYVRITGFPRSLFVAADGRVVGTWVMGNDYRVKSGYYGGYPAGYLSESRRCFRTEKMCCMSFPGKSI
jgi:hypothetical protein